MCIFLYIYICVYIIIHIYESCSIIEGRHNQFNNTNNYNYSYILFVSFRSVAFLFNQLPQDIRTGYPWRRAKPLHTWHSASGFTMNEALVYASCN